jgi:3-deoxy-D-manno-octulosonic-acid transferase
MPNLLDIAYLLLAGLSAPFWLIYPPARQKVLGALATRMGRVAPRTNPGPAVMIHAVSLGEINATRDLVNRLRHKIPDVQVIVSTTTDTGTERGRQLYGNCRYVTLVRFPLDFSWAINRFLKNLRPNVVVLMELEVWPNFLRQCRRRRLPVAVINGRITERSFARYRWIKPLAGRMFRQLDRICAQDQLYAQRFVELGATSDRVQVTGTMKFDTAETWIDEAKCEVLATAVGFTKVKSPIWVCGSTGPGEEEILLKVYQGLLRQFPKLRLVLVPRKPERFNEAADRIVEAGFSCRRRSLPQGDDERAVILGDTMGELRCWYALADVVFVGRTLVDLGPRQHGSDMIEPAALAKPVAVGPFTGNFAEPMSKFLATGAMKVVDGPSALERQLTEWLAEPASAAEIGARARQVVLNEQGATDRHVQVIVQLLGILP